MMKKQLFFLVFASIFLSSCGGSSSSESITDLSRMDRVEIKERKQISVDSVIEKIDYVKLGDTQKPYSFSIGQETFKR